jgi:hypothetical protein
MRWKVKQPKPGPSIGTIRKRTKFAIFPKRINDTIIWLERYWVREEFRLTQDYSFHNKREYKAWFEIERGTL